MEQRHSTVGAKVVQLWQKQGLSSKLPKSGRLRQKLAHPHAHRWAFIVSGGLAGLLVVVWLSGNVFARQLAVGNKRVRLHSSQTHLIATIRQQVSGYRLSVGEPGKSPAQYSLSDVGASVSDQAITTSIKKAGNSWRGRLLWWRPSQLELSVTVNEQTFAAFLSQHAHHESSPAKNALLKINSDGSVATEPESNGREIGIANARQTVLNKLGQLDTTPLQLAEQTIHPTITLSSLQSTKAKLDKILAQKVSLALEAKTVVPTAHDIGSWLVITPNEDKKTYDISIDSGKVSDYINAVAAANVQRPRNQVEVIHSDGTRGVLVKGADGIDVSNKDSAIKSIADSVLKQSGFSVALELKHTPFKVVSAPDGDKLVEVDVTTKRMYAYENGVLVRTFLVSAGAPATPTVTGQYAIYSKVRKQNMSGFNADGSKYLQPDVEWVNYFYRDYAVHGNYWRPLSYFGAVNSSHGCVGIVNSDAEWFYNWAPIGTPVIVHA